MKVSGHLWVLLKHSAGALALSLYPIQAARRGQIRQLQPQAAPTAPRPSKLPDPNPRVISSKVSRSCDPTSSQNHTLTFSHAGNEPKKLVRSSSSFEATAEKRRFQDKSCHGLSSKYHDHKFPKHRKPCTKIFEFSRSRAFSNSMLEKRNFRAEVKLRLSRLGLALREQSAPCVPIRLTWGRHRRGSAPVFIKTDPKLKRYSSIDVWICRRALMKAGACCGGAAP